MKRVFLTIDLTRQPPVRGSTGSRHCIAVDQMRNAHCSLDPNLETSILDHRLGSLPNDVSNRILFLEDYNTHKASIHSPCLRSLVILLLSSLLSMSPFFKLLRLFILLSNVGMKRTSVLGPAHAPQTQMMDAEYQTLAFANLFTGPRADG